jgi:DNA adenine methylase
MPLSPPFPWFGGKRRVADIVWKALGDVPNYVEPFAGAAAVLLARPDSHEWARHTETINDKDGLLVNLWRALKW